MTRADLPAILERLKAATGPDRDIDLAIGEWLRQQRRYTPWECFDYTRGGGGNIPFTASLDAIRALTERVLPGWDWILSRTNDGLTISCRLGDQEEFGETPVLACCIALVSALIAKEAEHGR